MGKASNSSQGFQKPSSAITTATTINPRPLAASSCLRRGIESQIVLHSAFRINLARNINRFNFHSLYHRLYKFSSVGVKIW